MRYEIWNMIYIYTYTDTKNGRYGRRPSIPRRYDFVFCANIVGLAEPCRDRWFFEGLRRFFGGWNQLKQLQLSRNNLDTCNMAAVYLFFGGENCGKTTFLQTFWREVYCVWLQMAQHHPKHTQSCLGLPCRFAPSQLQIWDLCSVYCISERKKKSQNCHVDFGNFIKALLNLLLEALWEIPCRRWRPNLVVVRSCCPFLEQQRRDLRSGYLPRISRGNEKPPVFKIEWDSGIFDRIPILLLGCLPNYQVLSSLP